jgi:RNA polymerase primary sigma factor
MSRPAGDAGTTILIVGFRDPSSDQEASPTQIAESIESAVVKHFWPALAARTLSVKVRVAENEEILRTVDVNVREAAPELTSMLQRYEVGGMNDGLQEPGDVISVDVPLAVPECKASDARHAAFKHNARLVIRRDDPSQESPSSGRAQFFRGTRMVVSERDFSRVLVGAQPFHAAVLCGTAVGNSLEDERAERFLRAAEPPAHTEWTMTEKVTLEYARGSKAALNAFMNAVREAVRDAMTPMVETPADGPRELAALFNFGEPPRPERAPRLVVDSAAVGPNGEWMVEGTIRVPKPTTSVAGRPTLVFDGESGTGTRASWLTLEAVKDCTVEGDVVRVTAGKRTARFKAVSDPSSHPIPTSRGAVSIDFRAVREDDRS